MRGRPWEVATDQNQSADGHAHPKIAYILLDLDSRAHVGHFLRLRLRCLIALIESIIAKHSGLPLISNEPCCHPGVGKGSDLETQGQNAREAVAVESVQRNGVFLSSV